MLPCDHCETPEYCAVEIRRCLHKGLSDAENEGELTDEDELNEGELKKRRLPNKVDSLNDKDRQFLKDILNY